MILTLLRVWGLTLRRDRVALAMTFVLPVAFFSIFASVFGRQGLDTTSRVRVLVVDEDRSAASRRLLAALAREGGLRVVTRTRPRGAGADAPESPVDRTRARAMVRGGEAPVALIVPAGFGGPPGASAASVDLMTDPADPVAPQMVGGLLQRAALAARPNPPAGTGVVRIHTVPVLGERRDNGMVAFYAAGMAVMFLLFSASSAGGSLLEEVESGTLERVLGTRLGMNGLLLGKWLYLVLLGSLQITVMFLWGMIAFRLDLLRHLPGFVVMTAVTAGTAAGFGLVLATACRTRAQLSSIATLVILCSSAVGGSLFPRFLMSETLRKAGLVTFNAWALDGYTKVFWRDASLIQLLPQVAVLLAYGAAFLVAARLLARRWEAV